MSYIPPIRSPSPWSGLRGRLARLWLELREPFAPLLERRGRSQGVGTLRLLLVHYPWAVLRSILLGLPRATWRFARHAPWPLRLAAVVALLGAGAAGAYVVKRELDVRQRQRVAAAWNEFEIAARKHDPAAVREALQKVLSLAPDDERATRRLAALDRGEADPDDQTLIRLLLNEHVRHNDYAAAAREARKRLAFEPKDWQAHCALAHQALRQGQRDEARAQLDALPPPTEARDLSPGSLLWSLRLHLEAGRDPADLLTVTVRHALPWLKRSDFPRLDPTTKLQLLECYQYSFRVLNNSPEVATYWVPAAAAAAQVLSDSAATPDNLVWLGQLQQQQLPALAELRRRSLVADADADALSKDLEDRIRRTWDRVRRLVPNRPQGYIGLAQAAARAGDTEAAIQVLEEGLRACGDRTELLAIQQRLLETADPTTSLAQIEHAAQARPDDLALWYLLARSALAARRYDKAAEACVRARKLQPDLEWACKQEAQLRLIQGRPTQALEALAPLAGRLYDDGVLLALRLQALDASGSGAAIEPLLKELRSRERSPEVLVRAGAALVDLHRPSLAAELADEVVRKHPDAADAWRIRANAQRLLAEPKSGATWDRDRARAALAAYERLLRLQPNDLVAVGNVAWLHLKALDDPKEADRRAEPLREALKKNELPVTLLEVVGAAALGVGQAEPARQVLERAAVLAPSTASCQLSLARAYVLLARRDDALRCLERAVALPRTAAETAELTALTRQLRGPS